MFCSFLFRQFLVEVHLFFRDGQKCRDSWTIMRSINPVDLNVLSCGRSSLPSCSLTRHVEWHGLFCKAFAREPVMPGFRPLHIFLPFIFLSTAMDIESYWNFNTRGFYFNAFPHHSIYGKAWGVTRCDLVTVVRQLCLEEVSVVPDLVFLVGKVVGRVFLTAAVVEMQVSISHADLCSGSGPAVTTLELARAEVLVICCAVAKDLWPCCYMGLHSNGYHFVGLEWEIIMRTNSSRQFLSRLSSFLSPVHPYALT